MPRQPRHTQWTDAACYHVLDRGHNRETVFLDDQDRAQFRTMLFRYRDRFDLRVYRYSLLGNHYHLLAQLPDPGRLSALMATLLKHAAKEAQEVDARWSASKRYAAIEEMSPAASMAAAHRVCGPATMGVMVLPAA